MHILVCGGAGYVGSHTAYVLAERGHEVTVLDNLSSGHSQAARWGRLIEADLMRPGTLDAAFERPVDAVMHFCARSLVGESVTAPYDYYDNNVVGSLNLLHAMRRHEVERLVFSSTAAVFGQPVAELIDEAHRKMPINPYGASKLMVERILADAAHAYGLRSVSLRYFNAAGAAAEAGIGESHTPETHLIPNVLRSALGIGPPLKVFGHGYPTPDGTCVRDYVHVLDLADAHVRAIEFMHRHPGAHAFNLGNGSGFSVLQVIEAARRATGQDIPFEFAPSRPGDPATLVAASDKARAQLGWRPGFAELGDIVASAWKWHRAPAY
ncbi:MULTISPECIES: UDP-glucose 4-epimerase GalE [unclassified Lysobacter]|uniref:UDP-glucose 4-epimerase GalE n=1 Tax=unclassified Lysobacter TaxID=2635362 RepID=UPI001BE98DF7|nr:MULTISPECIES: UDP-glucose 4-epimerase GalE [unclassified Lysobacter]MBT2748986.1 UDP-glucose 4-epimerase GalE [Lysobacter sp. ISL-42]MBT2751436.1 UDP-glucose 4-epimerase GalE [Lysobacter sp. ISL-50]MBT2778255.1 UDP-glucose 4-epimerase GalE [Lysobacter sp. ISL-54]MBT2782698.1 UDP-glucose 4-epimerase GalE [Lysobacter sp. ISL-52]